MTDISRPKRKQPAVDAPLSVEMVKLRWYLGELAAISAGAGDSDFIIGDDEENERRVKSFARS